MKSTQDPKLDVICLQRNDYRTVPLNPWLKKSVPKLEQLIKQGVYVKVDANRPCFYDVELADGWAYIYVREDAQIVYLIACIRTLAEAAMPR
jgi:hypothetical protein